MKIACPDCGKKLYTNPFTLNRQLHCPYCNHDLYMNTAGQYVLKRFFKIDLLTGLALLVLVHLMFLSLQVDLYVLILIAAEWMLELPQRHLIRNGVIKYADTPVDDLTGMIEQAEQQAQQMQQMQNQNQNRQENPEAKDLSVYQEQTSVDLERQADEAAKAEQEAGGQEAGTEEAETQAPDLQKPDEAEQKPAHKE